VAGKTGQGRKFVIENALQAALLVFWEYGYEGASLAKLTEVMGINPPSLYKAFGSKEQLFFDVVQYYNATHGSFMARAFAEEQDGGALIERLLREAADQYPSTPFPGGCLIISAAVAVTEGSKHVAERLAAMRNENIQALADREGVSLEAARFVGATLQGMSQQARDGASAKELHQIVDFAMSALQQHGLRPRSKEQDAKARHSATGSETIQAELPNRLAR